LDLGVSNSSDGARRAARLLRWYPPAWRERYGEEFADHLEQEFADRPVDPRRSLNVACKGLVARVEDIGLLNASRSPSDQTRAALGTSFALLALAAVIALNFWSWAMLQWSARTYHPIPVDATTGILTVATGILLLVLVAIVLIVLGSAVRQIVRGRGRRVVGPLVFAAVSVACFCYFLPPWLPGMFARYSHMFQGGYRWTHPGPAAYGLATIAHVVTQPWVSMWDPGISGEPTSQTVMNDLAPLAVLVFAVAMAFLVRRVELPRLSERLGSATVVLLGILSGVFLLTLVVWFTVGGPIYATFGETGNIAGVAYLVFLALVAVLVARSGLLASKNRSGRKLNHIEILGENLESS
jgi:hypothetical protein